MTKYITTFFENVEGVFFLFYVYVCFAWLCKCVRLRAWSSQTEQGDGFSGTRIMDGFEPSCVSWKPNPGLLQEQVFLAEEPAPQHQC